jgi:hypothetical protein
MSEEEKNVCADIHKCLDVAMASVRGVAAADLELPAEEQEPGSASERTKASNHTPPHPPTPSPPSPPGAAPAVASVPIAPGAINATQKPAPETPPQLRTFQPGHPPRPIKIVRQVMRRIQDPDESRNTEVCTGCMLDFVCIC